MRADPTDDGSGVPLTLAVTWYEPIGINRRGDYFNSAVVLADKVTNAFTTSDDGMCGTHQAYGPPSVA